MRTTRSARIAFILTILSFSIVFSSAQALNGDARVISCASCQTPIDFRNFAMSDSAVNAGSDVSYTVISNSASMSAFVLVTGYWMVDPFSGQAWWTVSGAAMKDEMGAPLSTDVPTAQVQMSVIDVGLFGFGRSNTPKVASVRMPTAYSWSFINSSDEEDGPGVHYAVTVKTPGAPPVPVGTKVLVTYQDGTKAVFVKKSLQGSDMWEWDGRHAWDAQGRPISGRGGSVTSNPNTSGGGSGTVSFSQTLSDANGLWTMYQAQKCQSNTTITINGVLDSFISSYIPC
jgi:hypothetical protein